MLQAIKNLTKHVAPTPATPGTLMNGRFSNIMKFQEGESDCSVPVFGELTGLSREELLREMPNAVEGRVTVLQWESWLRSKGLKVDRHQRDEEYTLPCAHLLLWAGRPHWIYEDETGVHEPNPAFMCVPPDDPIMLSHVRKREFTISVNGLSHGVPPGS